MSQEGDEAVPASPKLSLGKQRSSQDQQNALSGGIPSSPSQHSGRPNFGLSDSAGLQQTAHGAYGSFNMSAMGGALPSYGSPQPYQTQMQLTGARHEAVSPSTAMHYQIQQPLQYNAHGYPPQAYGNYAQPSYPQAYGQGSSPQTYGPYQQGQPYQTGVSPGQQYSPNPGPFYYYPDPYGRPAASPATYSPQNTQLAGMMVQGQPRGFHDQTGGRRLSGGPIYGSQYYNDDHALRQNTSAIPRGPPRKPKQSGHALWVGNLPPGATIGPLKDHFSRDFTRQIESLFLISKSNCAFVNYRTEDACAQAMQKFHDSRFEGVRLVCRLRKGSGATAGAPTGPAAITGLRASITKSALPESEGPEETESNGPENDGETEMSEPPPAASDATERFFIVKSLTLQDLEQSVRNGIWATQSHNEEALNKAFRSAENVYLIFSANKSGEYFGYARMVSPIAENASEILGTVHRTTTTDSSSFAPRTIATPATEHAPRGHIIDDSARGTIFWEAEFTDDEDEASESSDSEADPPTWGKPFRIEWLSTTRLPFYRTRGLRNAWNANREVKIARDGTELETTVGRRLLQLFHRNGPQVPQS